MSVSIGVDIGSVKTMIVADDGEIVLTDTGSTFRPTLVAFSGQRRLIGEEALPEISGENTVSMINLLLGRTTDTWDDVNAHRRLKRAKTEQDINTLTVNYNFNQEEFSATSILGMFLAKQMERIRAVYPAAEPINLAIALPPSYDPSIARAVSEAAQVAAINLDTVRFVDSSDCLTAAYGRKLTALRGADRSNIEGKKSLIVEMGATHTTVVVCSIDTVEAGPTRLATAFDSALGAFHFDMKLFTHFAAICKQKGTEVEPGTKRGLRLLSGCERIRKLLSQLNDGAVTIENLTDAGDMNFSLRREEMHVVCDDLLTRLRALILSALEKAGISAEQIFAIEIVGGGVRMPCVQTILGQTFGTEIALGAKLDDGSVAIGAALLVNRSLVIPTVAVADEGTAPVPETVAPKQVVSAAESLASSEAVGHTPEQIVAARAREVELQLNDAKLVEMHAARNELESFILEMRSAPRRKHGNKINAAALETILNDSENWLWDNAEASVEDTKQQNQNVREKVNELCAEYFAAVEEEKKAVEQALQEEAQRAEAERGDDEDHDNRKLRKPERMRLVVKNKDEGTELFKGGNFRPAAARYQKALTHCAKFFDLSPEDEAEVKALKATLYLNVSMCYIKLENWDQALRCVNDAIGLDDKNPKSYFRRATVYEAKRDWEMALQDIKKCQELTDVEDKVVTKTAERIKKEIQKEKDKEKKMWGKAFSK